MDCYSNNFNLLLTRMQQTPKISKLNKYSNRAI